MEILKKILTVIKLVGVAAAVILCTLLSNSIHDNYIYGYKGKSVIFLSGYKNGATATGFQVRAASGKLFVMTNRHVCDGLRQDDNYNMIHYKNGATEGTLNVIYRDYVADLCLLEPADGVPALSIASKLYDGEKAFLLGHPAGRDLTFEKGYFVGYDYIELQNYCYENIQEGCDYGYNSSHFNIISYPGNSGSPILDSFGNVIGVLFAGRRDQSTATHVVPLKDIQRVLAKH